MHCPPGEKFTKGDKPVDAHQLLRGLSKGEYEPGKHIVQGLQEVINLVHPIEPEVILVRQTHDPCDGYYIKTGVSQATVEGLGLSKVTSLEPLTFVTSTTAAVVIDTRDDSFVARIIYTKAPLFAHKERIAAAFTEDILTKSMSEIGRGDAHPALGPMYGYGHRVPMGDSQPGFYSLSARADPEWREELDEKILPVFHETLRTCFHSVHKANKKDTEQVALPGLPHNQVSTMFVTIRYQSASHTDHDRSLTLGYWIKVGEGAIVGGEFLFPAHRVAVPLRGGCIILWDGNKPHCTALAEYHDGAYYLASVLMTPWKLWNHCLAKRTNNGKK